MANLSIRNLPDDVYRELKKLAKQNKHSVNNELVYFITDNFKIYQLSPKKKNNKPDLLEKIKRQRKDIQKKGIKIDAVKLVRELRDEGRF